MPPQLVPTSVSDVPPGYAQCEEPWATQLAPTLALAVLPVYPKHIASWDTLANDLTQLQLPYWGTP